MQLFRNLQGKRIKHQEKSDNIIHKSKRVTFTNLRVAFRTKNTIQYHLRLKISIKRVDKFRCSGVFQLTCRNCKMTYTGQTVDILKMT